MNLFIWLINDCHHHYHYQSIVDQYLLLLNVIIINCLCCSMIFSILIFFYLCFFCIHSFNKFHRNEYFQRKQQKNWISSSSSSFVPNQTNKISSLLLLSFDNLCKKLDFKEEDEEEEIQLKQEINQYHTLDNGVCV